MAKTNFQKVTDVIFNALSWFAHNEPVAKNMPVKWRTENTKNTGGVKRIEEVFKGAIDVCFIRPTDSNSIVELETALGIEHTPIKIKPLNTPPINSAPSAVVKTAAK